MRMFVRRHFNSIRNTAGYIGVILLARWLLGLGSDESPDRLVSPKLLIELGIVMGVLLLISIMGVRWMARSGSIDMSSVRISEREDLAWPVAEPVMRPADLGPDRADLERVGFRHIGSFDVAMPDQTAIIAVLIDELGETIAIRTPLHLTLVCDFNGKLLTTSNSAIEFVEPYQLAQCLPATVADAALTAHRNALEMVAVAGARPVPLHEDNVMQMVLDMERDSIRNHKNPSAWRLALGMAMLTVQPSKGALLVDNVQGRARIEHWMSKPDRWQPTPA